MPLPMPMLGRLPLRRSASPLVTRMCVSLCALAMLGQAALPALAQTQTSAPPNLPALGDPLSDDFGIGTERRVGDQIMADIRRDPDYLQDPVLLEYMQSLWLPLLQQARARGNISSDIDQRFAWEIFLVRDRSVNAFALPGGFVGVHLGLVAMTSTPEELASVLAHEMSHVTQRHIARGVTNSKQQSMIGIATMILGVLAASRARNADIANAAIAGGQAVGIQGQLNFSRDMEREADRIGYTLLSGAGFEPGGMASMFEKLDQSSRLNDSGGYPYLRSHPLTTERLGEARSRQGVRSTSPPVSVLEHDIAQARSRVLMDPRVDALRRWQAQDAERSGAGVAEQVSAAYASALASTLLRDWTRADASLATAQARVASQRTAADASAADTPPRGAGSAIARAERALTMLRVQSLLERSAPDQAGVALQPLAADKSRPVMLLRAQAALGAALAGNSGSAGNASNSGTSGNSGNSGNSGSAGTAPEPAEPTLKRSADELQTWVALNPQDDLAWAALGRAWERLGQPLRALRAEAEARIAIGDLPGGIDRLRAGQRRARDATGSTDFIEASVLDARLREVEAQRRQLLAEQAGKR